jgi:hypothetical protein
MLPPLCDEDARVGFWKDGIKLIELLSYSTDVLNKSNQSFGIELLMTQILVVTFPSNQM